MTANNAALDDAHANAGSTIPAEPAGAGAGAVPDRIDLSPYFDRLPESETIRLVGTVRQAAGLVIESAGPPASIGEVCEVISGRRQFQVEVVGFRDQHVVSMPSGRMVGVQVGDRIVSRGKFARVPVGDALLGRVIDSSGEPLDEAGALRARHSRALASDPVNPLDRAEIEEPLSTGVSVVDGCLTIGRGQRIGLFGGSGVGKSTLLAMMARHTSADVNVLALVGERGREVRAFIEDELGDALGKSVVVVATSEHSPLMRIRAALAATAIAEDFREKGRHVLLMMDSLTRFAMAQREVGLATGEPPSTKGYTPSVFSVLPALVERAGLMAKGGSITGVYTVLVEGDDMNDPIADAARSLLDGHIVLSRGLAERGHFPAVDVPQSLSRLMPALVQSPHQEAARKLRSLLATLAESADLIQLGAYTKGTNPEVDEALERKQAIETFLQQSLTEHTNLDEAVAALQSSVGVDAGS
jgi:FliI/YscN family ATPase